MGEASDKVARILGLPYPGGPQISKLAESVRSQSGGGGRRAGSGESSATLSAGEWGPGPSEPRSDVAERITLPRPMIHDNTCNFSFAGLKTAVLYALKNIELTDAKKAEVAHEFEEAVGEVLWKKTARALEQTGAKTLVIGGGVSANTHVRRVFTEKIAEYGDVALRIPAAALTTDNAIMIALAGFYRALNKEFATDIKANGNLSLT